MGRSLFKSEWKRVVSFWVVIILKFHLNGFFGECDIWAIFQSQNHYSSKALLWGLLLQNLVFWQLICYLSAKSHWWQGHKWNDWWALGTWWLSWKSVFSLFSCSWKEKCQSFFSLISFSKISKMKVLKYTIVLFIHLKIWSRNWIYFFVTSSWIYLAFYSLLSFKKHCTASANLIKSFCQL